MRSSALLALLVATALAFAPAARAADPQRELEEAEQLAVRGQAGAAIDAYRALLERGVDSPALRYNLGTLYLEEQDLGRAVLHLRSALRQDPRLDDARYNLERALEARADELEGAPRGPSASTRIARLVRSQEAAIAFAVCLLLFVLALGLWPWTQPRSTLRRLCKGAFVLFTPLLALSSLLLAARVQEDARSEAVVVTKDVSALIAPEAEAAVSFVAHAGLYGEVVAEESGYARLRLENGLDAWFPRASLGVVGDTRHP